MTELVTRFRRTIALGAGAALAALHIGILLRRIADGSLLSLQVLAQWSVGALIVAVAIVLRRRGVSVFRGRSGVAFWIVVVLMHGIVALPGGPGFVGVLGAAQATTFVPVSLGLVVGALVLLIGLAALGRNTGLLRFGPRHGARSLAFPGGLPPAISPRAPPA